MSLTLSLLSSRPSPRPWLLLLPMLLPMPPPLPLLPLPRRPWTPWSTPTRRRRLLSLSCCPGNNHRVLCERVVRSYRIGVVGVAAVARPTTPPQPTRCAHLSWSRRRGRRRALLFPCCFAGVGGAPAGGARVQAWCCGLPSHFVSTLLLLHGMHWDRRGGTDGHAPLDKVTGGRPSRWPSQWPK